MHLNKKNSKFLFKKLLFLINISYAGWPAGPRANPYTGRVRKISPQILCGAGQPNPLFAGQVRDGPARIATPNKISSLAFFFLFFFSTSFLVSNNCFL